MTNPFPFSSNAVLTASQLNEIGSFDTWTPTFTGLTAQPTIGLAAYTEVNDLVYYMMYVEIDSGDLPFTGSLTCTAPVPTSGAMTYMPQGQAWLRPSGGTIFHGTQITTGNSIYFYGLSESGTYSTVSNVNATVPATWTTDGDFWAMGWYRSA